MSIIDFQGLKLHSYMPTEMDCSICHTVIEADGINSTLLCNHTYHTRCLIEHVAFTGIQYARCNVCDAHVIPRDIIQTNTPETENTVMETIDTFYKTQPAFVKEIKMLKSSWASVEKKHAEMRKTTNKSIKIFHAEINDVRCFLKDKFRQKLSEFKKATEYTDYKRSARSHSGKLRGFVQRWGVDVYTLSTYLRRKGVRSTFLLTNNHVGRFDRIFLRKFRIRI
jgi:hypothetical protein